MTCSLPVYRDREAYKSLVKLYGLPNSAPTSEEVDKLGPLAFLQTRRVVFVDDWDSGRAVALWMPWRL